MKVLPADYFGESDNAARIPCDFSVELVPYGKGDFRFLDFTGQRN